MNWYGKVTRDSNDLSPVLDAMEYYERQHGEGVVEMDHLHGSLLIDVQSRLSGIVEHRYRQLLEIEAIIAYLQIREDAAVGTQRRFYVEHYNRKLTDRMVEKFAETHPDVIALRELRNHVVMVRNKFVALSRRHEYMHYQLSNITRLRVAGMHDAVL